ncbi:type I restriction endonuclease subunit R [Globicatella sulfidifaciens]|uniref:Type I restriction enzyme, R subunit n=1 Tax=Globicatella sulfidifaciens DSM 15739 TaxID=1121925 RepID=A0A1T4M9I2_9LACT|nr:DEAD/DEAH box helicase family protein [Globicatella sulfidifaciens]SJZ63545.1 type I restriction enzyme, R subunit [Globicatella sulfidifaciens DSM 15739]
MEYKEIRFEEDIETYLLNHGGYEKGNMATYDKEKAIDMETFLRFIQTSQPKEWERYEKIYREKSEEAIYKRFDESVKMHGLLSVLRDGVTDRGIRFRFAFFKPESTLNQKVIDNYNNNILTLTRQFYYSNGNRNSIDMVLSLNGIPIIALELKNQLTGQTVDNGKSQFIENRNPREKCFNFNHRFLVYFALDHYDVEMTTELKGRDTFFLPFNQGSNGAGNVGGKGNPANPNGYATSYLWEKVLKKDTLLDIIQRFMHLEEKTETKVVKGKEVKKTRRRLIFPRYHQLDVVNKLIEDVRIKGTGEDYLIQHSAGSGKSNSIAWLAYGLSNLHDKDDQPIFTSVIIVSDRRVLDSQLQETIMSFDHTPGVVETIGKDKTSQDLKDAINNNRKIIVTTLQKFPVIYEEVDESKGKRYAVIVDEAHQSQSGSSAKMLKTALADTEEALREFAEIEGMDEEEALDNEDKLVEEILSHGKHNNLSFFAFTATPKKETIDLFGTEREYGNKSAYHNYSMRQAIEEGFILDVLQNYMTYNTCYKIAKDTEENPEVPSSTAVRTINRFASLHPHNLQQKTQIIVEQFRDITKNKINGRGKAMVVTASRLHAVRYYHEIKNYIEIKGYDDLEILVAFSGIIKDKGVEFTEEKMNKRKDGSTIKESQLPTEFASDDFNMLIVAEKYQTGFDQPLLHTMFVDKRLRGVKAVQTLSRLNRITPGKEDTFVLDFVNTKEEIEEAFKPYYEATILDETINVNLIYDTQILLREARLYNDDDIERFVNIYYKEGKQTPADLGKITSLIKPIINRYLELSEEDQFKFRKDIRNFNKWYSYIIQITRMYDKDLHKEYVFTSYLQKLIPSPERISLDLDGKLKLEFYKLDKTFEGDISIIADPTIGYGELDTGSKPKEDEDYLDEIINRINERYHGDFTDQDRVVIDFIYKEASQGLRKESLTTYAKKNDSEVFKKSIFPKDFEDIAFKLYKENKDRNNSFKKLFQDKEFYNAAMSAVGEMIYKDLRS